MLYRHLTHPLGVSYLWGTEEANRFITFCDVDLRVSVYPQMRSGLFFHYVLAARIAGSYSSFEGSITGLPKDRCD
jgi:hypothetical protein